MGGGGCHRCKNGVSAQAGLLAPTEWEDGRGGTQEGAREPQCPKGSGGALPKHISWASLQRPLRGQWYLGPRWRRWGGGKVLAGQGVDRRGVAVWQRPSPLRWGVGVRSAPVLAG